MKHVETFTENTEDKIWSLMEIINAARRGGVSRGTSIKTNDENAKQGNPTKYPNGLTILFVIAQTLQ